MFGFHCAVLLWLCVLFLQVNKKLLYHESDLLDVGLVVQRARKQDSTVTVIFDRVLQPTVLLLQIKKSICKCRTDSYLFYLLVPLRFFSSHKY